MNTGIIRTALTKALSLELDYREPLASEEEAAEYDIREICGPQRHISADDFHQLLRAI
jgi:hypothetical protein